MLNNYTKSSESDSCETYYPQCMLKNIIIEPFTMF